MGSRDPRDERPSEYTDFKFSVSCRSLFLPAASIGYQNINLIRVEVLWGKRGIQDAFPGWTPPILIPISLHGITAQSQESQEIL